jgi:hypothetical protein
MDQTSSLFLCNFNIYTNFYTYPEWYNTLPLNPTKYDDIFSINAPQQNVHIPILMKDTCSLHVNKDCNVSLFYQNYSLHLLFGGNAGAEERQLVGRKTPITLLYYYD